MAAAVVTGERARAMAARLAATAERLRIDAAGRDLLRAAYETGLAPRVEAGLDDHHPDFLHTARTALILMDDAAVADPTTLAAALLTETRDPRLRVAPEAVRVLSEAVAAVLGEVPDPDEPETLLEGLVSASDPAALVALAERLDHARHLHLRDAAEQAAYHALTRAVYAPFAARVHPVLAQRISWWCAMFERRFLSGA